MKLLIRLLIIGVLVGAAVLLAYAVIGQGQLLDGSHAAVRAPTPRSTARPATTTPTARLSLRIPAHGTATRAGHPVSQPTPQDRPSHPHATPTTISKGSAVLPHRMPGLAHSEPRKAIGGSATAASGASGGPPRSLATPTGQTSPKLQTPAPNPNVSSTTLIIPRLGIRAPVYERGVDAVGQLPIAHGYSVTHYLFSAPLGGVGNYVIYGHDDIEGSIFQYLPNLRVGDFIYLNSGSRHVTYQVTRSLVVTPDQVWVMEPTSTATLTAISCVPYGIDTHRIIVKARLVSDRQA